MNNQDDGGEWQLWFERIWAYREEELYPSLFGKVSEGIFTLSPQVFTGPFGQKDIDPRWLHFGVFRFAPTESRNSWLHVTSGMSNAWEAEKPDSNAVSGLGSEFIFETTIKADWAILRLLHAMAFQILLCHGRYPGKSPLADYDRIPLREPISGAASALTWLMVTPSPRVTEVRLESGHFSFFQLIGVSEAEAAHARSHGGPAMVDLLRSKGFFPVTDPDRESQISG
jgi:hypothetical protein